MTTPAPPPIVHLVAAAIIVAGERILITQRPTVGQWANQWEFPGGKLHWAETPEAGLRREILEELGIPIEVGSPVHIIHYALDATTAFAVMFYWSRPLGGEIQRLGCQDARWISVTEFDQFEFLKPNLPVVNLLKNRVRQLGGLFPSFPVTTPNSSLI